MATSPISSVNAHSFSPTTNHSLKLSQMVSSVYPNMTKKLFPAHFKSTTRLVTTRKFKSPSALNSFDHTPKKLKEENFKDGYMSAEHVKDDRIARISSAIRVIPNFPKPGIIFQDITTLLLDPKAFQDTIDLFVERYKDKNISVVAGEVISEEYLLEYGTDKIEMHVGAVQAGERAIVIDDLIATGGTLSAAIRLLERVEVEVVECACLIELPALKGRERLGDKPLFILVTSA